MTKFLKKLIENQSREKLLSLLLIFSFGMNSLSYQVTNQSEQEQKLQVKKQSLPQENQSKRRKILDKDGHLLYDSNTLLDLNPNFINLRKERAREVNKKIKVALTAYSSNFFECDGNPFRTASGSYVRDGIVATNFLPFGTKIKISEVFGDKIFIVEDRMAKRYWYRVDIWMPSYKEAVNFGKKYAEIEILN